VRVEELVWNTRLWTESGVGDAGSGLGFLNGHAAKQGSKASEEGGEGC
jgi:hypothetical protein